MTIETSSESTGGKNDLARLGEEKASGALWSLLATRQANFDTVLARISHQPGNRPQQEVGVTRLAFGPPNGTMRMLASGRWSSSGFKSADR